MSKELLAKLDEDLKLSGYAKRSRQSYVRAVRQLMNFWGREYWLHCKDELDWGGATLRISYSGIKFFFQKTLKRDWETLRILKVQRHITPPVVLSVDEVRNVLEALPTPMNRAFYTTVYSLGLRLGEARHLAPPDIDSERMCVRIRDGKGGVTRSVPLPDMNRIQQIFRDHGEDYLQACGGRIPPDHRKAIRAICDCRSGACGHHVFQCAECGKTHVANSSCGNRHCPVCQHDKNADWVYRQQLKRLPCTYFMVTFTLPEELRAIARRHSDQVYAALFDCAAESLRTLEADTRFAGCKVAGFFGVLHTWGRQLQVHPHVHFIVPGGGLSADRHVPSLLAEPPSHAFPTRVAAPVRPHHKKTRVHGISRHEPFPYRRLRNQPRL